MSHVFLHAFKIFSLSFNILMMYQSIDFYFYPMQSVLNSLDLCFSSNWGHFKALFPLLSCLYPLLLVLHYTYVGVPNAVPCLSDVLFIFIHSLPFYFLDCISIDRSLRSLIFLIQTLVKISFLVCFSTPEFLFGSLYVFCLLLFSI